MSTADTQQIRVLIVEDHIMFSQALTAALDEEDDIAVAASVHTGEAGVSAVSTEHPDVVLLDYRLPDQDGVETARRMKAIAPDVRIVMLTAVSDDSVLRQAIEAGCSGYLTKNQSVEELVLAVRAAHNGESLISPELLGRLVNRMFDRTRPGADLTAREAEVLRLLSEGLSNQAIAKSLGVQLATVRNHVQSVIEKMHAHSKLEAVAAALRLGVIQPPG